MGDLCFSEIILSGAELDALEAASEAPVLVDSGNSAALYSLLGYGLVIIAACPAGAAAPFAGTYPKAASATPRGRACLAYVRGRESERRSRLRRDVAVAFISGASGFALSELLRLLGRLLGGP